MTELVRRRPLGAWHILVLGVLVGSAAVLVTVLAAESASDRFGWDFRYQYFTGAEAVVDGRPLYMSPDDPGLEMALNDVMTYVYPPLVAVASVPLTALSVDAATVLVFLASVAALLGALGLVGVRDARCYAALLLWSPTWTSLAVLNVSSFLVLAVAVAWRYRDTLWPIAMTLGLAVAAKIFMWPLLVWVVAMRRVATATAAVVIAAVATLASWAAVGFQGLRDYPALARKLSDMHADDSYSIEGMTSSLGVDPSVARSLMLLVGSALLIAGWRYCRTADEKRGFACANLAALALTPILWQHYLLLLAVPLGLVRPRFSWVWLLPILLWVSPHEGNGSGLQPFVPAAVVVALGYVLLAPRREASSPVEAIA